MVSAYSSFFPIVIYSRNFTVVSNATRYEIFREILAGPRAPSGNTIPPVPARWPRDRDKKAARPGLHNRVGAA